MVSSIAFTFAGRERGSGRRRWEWQGGSRRDYAGAPRKSACVSTLISPEAAESARTPGSHADSTYARPRRRPMNAITQSAHLP